jgi:hypothetical protein
VSGDHFQVPSGSHVAVSQSGTRQSVPSGSQAITGANSAITARTHHMGGVNVPGLDDGGLEATTRAAELLAASVTQTRLYGPRHPEALRLIAVLQETLHVVLAGIGPSEWTIASEGFFWDGQQLTVEREDKPGLAYYLHSEGMALLRFEPGITREELVLLIMAFRTNLSLPAFEEETLESILFQAEFEHVGFEAVSHLMEAEALSGRTEEIDAAALLERLMVLEESRSPDIAGKMGDRNQVTGERVQTAPEDDGYDWDAQLSRSADEDLQSLQHDRDRLDMERDADQIGRLANLFLRAAGSGDPSINPTEALNLANGALQQVYAAGDATCLLSLFEEAHTVARALETDTPDIALAVHKFVRSNLAPLRVAKMMRNLNLEDVRDRFTFQRFTERLTPEILIVFLDGLDLDDLKPGQLQLIRGLWQLQGKRLFPLIEAAETAPQSITTLLSSAAAAEVNLPRELRSRLLANRSSTIRTAILPWYQGELPVGDVPAIAALIGDRVAAVRRAASEILLRHRPPTAWPILADMIRGEGFIDLHPTIKNDLCIVAARVAGPATVDLLAELLNTRTGFRVDPRDQASMEAGARGLAYVKSPTSISLLEKGSRGWSGPRRNACLLALEEVDTGGGA